jgi:hypothetical protein
MPRRVENVGESPDAVSPSQNLPGWIPSRGDVTPGSFRDWTGASEFRLAGSVMGDGRKDSPSTGLHPPADDLAVPRSSV